MARAKKKWSGSRKRREVEDEVGEQVSLFATMKPATIRGIAGVLFFVLAILLVLAALGMAGVAGVKLFNGLYWLVGIGYFLLPLMFAAWAVSLFSKREGKASLRPIRTTGAVLFFLSSLATVAVLSAAHAGKLGILMATPMLSYLDTVATLVVLIGLTVVSLLLMFDGELWIMLFRFFIRLVRGKHTEEEELAEDSVALAEEMNASESESAEPLEEEKIDEEGSTEDEEQKYDDEEGEDKQILGGILGGGKRSSRGKDTQTFEMPSEYTPPPLSLLESDRGKANVGDTKARANLIRRTLQHFKIPVEMDEIVVGPTVTRYSLKPAEGVRLNRIVQLQQNLELALAASPIRIEAPIPGRSLVGIEVPNTGKSIVGLSGLLSSPEFTEETVPLFVTLGKDISGSAHYANIGKMPHLLVAGSTGSGKTVMIHTLIASLLYRNGPERLRFIMIDPKQVGLTLFDDIPHLLTPVITDAKKCILSLKWATKEMERRYDILREHKVQDIESYHQEIVVPKRAQYEKLKTKGKDVEDFELPEPMPHIVIIIDELSDIMMAYPRELEAVIVRLAQMSRAVGIHLILSTQRPEVKVITGLIKANIPSRIALRVASLVDSRTILDQPGAEKLLGAGDMLYLSGDMAKPRRIQSPFITTGEVKKIAQFLIKNNTGELAEIDFSGDDNGENGSSIPFEKMEEDEELDDLYESVREFVIQEKKASTSLIQRHFKVGYGRAARIMDQLEKRGVIAASDGTNRPRDILIGPAEDSEYSRNDGGADDDNIDDKS